MRSFYFFGYDSKLLRLSINEQVMSFLGHVSTCWKFCSLVGAAEAVCSFCRSCLQLQLKLFQLLQKLLQFPLGPFFVFLAKFSLLEKMFDEVLEM